MTTALITGVQMHGAFKLEKFSLFGSFGRMTLGTGLQTFMMADHAGIVIGFMGSMIKGYQRCSGGVLIFFRTFLIRPNQYNIGLLPLHSGHNIKPLNLFLAVGGFINSRLVGYAQNAKNETAT